MDSFVSHSIGLLVKMDQNNHKLSYHDWRYELKKLKRKAQRKRLARLRDSSLSGTNGSTENQKTVSGEEENDEDERQRQLQNELWLERERAAQALFLAKKDREEKERQQKEDEQRKIKEEWEQQQRKQKEEEEKQKNDKERIKEEMKRQPKKHSDDCHNPPAPPEYNADSQEQRNCPFFQKVGACRFGLNCKRAHNVPETSTTLLFPGMFAHFELEQSFRDEFDSDLTLEYEEGDIYDEFKLFYEDVFPEFQAVGHVIQFVVCCNYEPHLRGNVYAQYASKDEALSAFEKFNGRWYNKRQLSCQFTSVDNWKSAICGLFRYKKCPKGKNCNFLHVFQNPYSEHMSDHRKRRREPEPSQKQRNIKNTYEKSSSSRKKSYTSSKCSSHRSASKSPTYSHRKRQKSCVHRRPENSNTSDQTTSHRISGSSSRKHSSISSCRRESSGSSSESDECEHESSGNKYRKYSSHVHRRGHPRAENTNTDSVRRDKSLKNDSELGNSRIKTDICLKETDITSEDKSSSSKLLEDGGCAKYRNENECTERRSKRSKDHDSKKSKTKKLKLE